MNELGSPEVLLVPLVVGIMEVAKIAKLPIRLVPVMTLLVSVFLGYFIGIDWVTGLVLGLSSMGLWSGVKKSIGK